MSWTAPAGAVTGYDISVDDGSNWRQLTSNGATTSIDIDGPGYGMHSGGAYQVQVRAKNSTGAGAASGAVEIVIPGVDVGAEEVAVHWGLPSTSGIANWQYSKNSGPWTDVPNSTSSSVSFTDDDVESLALYRYRVRAVDSGGTALITSFAVAVVPGKITDGFRGIRPRSGKNYFGSSVAVSSDGTTLAMGAVSRNTNRVYVFTRSGGVWSFDTTITGTSHGLTSRRVGDGLGTSVALSSDGSLLFVGAPYADTGGSNRGAVYVFAKSGGAWSLDTTIDDGTDGLSLIDGARLGASVAANSDGTLLFAGAPLGGGTIKDDLNFQRRQGRVYVFAKSGGAWSRYTTIEGGSHGLAGGADLGDFGGSIALSSDESVLAVGAPRRFYIGNPVVSGRTHRGSVHVFAKSGGAWSHDTTIESGTHGLNLDSFDNYFGSAVALTSDGGILYVGNSGNNFGGIDRGAFHFFAKAGSQWEYGETVKNGSRGLDLPCVNENLFGQGVAVSSDGSVVYVGAPGDDACHPLQCSECHPTVFYSAVYLFANAPPVFAEREPVSRRVMENTAAGADIGAAVSAGDADGDALAYSLSGDGEPHFTLGETDGQLRTRGALDYESKSSYSVSVTARDGNGGSATVAVTVYVYDVDTEAPQTPQKPEVSAPAPATLVVNWDEPPNSGPAITDYNVEYRAGSTGPWTAHPHTGTARTTTISGLSADTTYQARVQAANAEGASRWSAASSTATTKVAASPLLPPPGPPLPPAGPAGNRLRFYSRVIDSPDFCLNASLGGPRTFPFDSNRDGIADVCSLPYTRLKAIARQNALHALAETLPDGFRARLESKCALLQNTDFGDDPQHLAQDACAPHRQQN